MGLPQTQKNLKRIGWYTPVVTGSMRNRVRPQGIEAPRDAHNGDSEERRGCAEVPHPRCFSEERILKDLRGRFFYKKGNSL